MVSRFHWDLCIWATLGSILWEYPLVLSLWWIHFSFCRWFLSFAPSQLFYCPCRRAGSAALHWMALAILFDDSSVLWNLQHQSALRQGPLCRHRYSDMPYLASCWPWCQRTYRCSSVTFYHRCDRGRLHKTGHTIPQIVIGCIYHKPSGIYRSRSSASHPTRPPSSSYLWISSSVVQVFG